jgi:signal transduction histidine kinase
MDNDIGNLAIDFKELERLDELVGVVFAKTKDLSANLRYRLFVPLLQSTEFESLGLDSKIINDELRNELGQCVWDDVGNNIKYINDYMGHIATISYIVISYWNPIDKHRRSIVFRKSDSVASHHRAILCACLFYGLTFLGPKQEAPIYSLVHYISERATHKTTVFTDFSNHNEYYSAGTVVSIPDQCHNLLHILGIEDILSGMSISGSRDSCKSYGFELQNLLLEGHSATINDELTTVVDRAIGLFMQNVLTLSKEHNNIIANNRQILSELLMESSLSTVQTCFFMATQLLWRETCPETQFMYTFPNHGAGPCSIVTFGTSGRLNNNSISALSYIAKSLITHPLIQDYAAKEAIQRRDRQTSVVRHFLSHNLPKFLIKPVTSELREIDRILERASSVGELYELRQRISALRILYIHYDSVLGTILSSKNLKNALTLSNECMRYKLEDICNTVRTIFPLLAQQNLRRNPILLASAHLEIDPSVQSIELWGHSKMLTEMVINLVNNALKAIDPRRFVKDYNAAGVRISADVCLAPSEDYDILNFMVEDHGKGFVEDDIERFEKYADDIGRVDEQEFWSTVEGLIEHALDDHCSEEHMGIGLLFCMAYLRSLEWEPRLKSAGRLSIMRRPKGGTIMSMKIPGVIRQMTADSAKGHQQR